MPELILNEEQAKLVHEANGTILVRDNERRVLGRIEPEFSPEMIADLKRRAALSGPRYTGEQVQARLRALQEEWNRTGSFDEERLKELLAQLNCADPGHERKKNS